MSAMAELDAIAKGLIPVTIELGSRGQEVVNYAIAHGLTVETAVVRLMNSGLSHLQQPVDTRRIVATGVRADGGNVYREIRGGTP